MVTLNEKAWMQAWAHRAGTAETGDDADEAVTRVAGHVAPDERRTADGPRQAGERITCGFCGQEFVEDPSQATCQACPLKKACGLMRCPHCGYENPKQPGWIARLKEWIR